MRPFPVTAGRPPYNVCYTTGALTVLLVLDRGFSVLAGLARSLALLAFAAPLSDFFVLLEEPMLLLVVRGNRHRSAVYFSIVVE